MNAIIIPEYLHHLHDIRIGRWYYEEGDHVDAEERLVDVSTEEGIISLTATMGGVVDQVYVYQGERVEVADIIGIIVSPESVIENNHAGTVDDTN